MWCSLQVLVGAVPKTEASCGRLKASWFFNLASCKGVWASVVCTVQYKQRFDNQSALLHPTNRCDHLNR